MSPSRNVIDTSSAPSRPIGKAITYHDCSEEQLLKEIAEYVVTEQIEDSLRRVLDGIESTQDGGQRLYTGVLVTGDSGAGKSSFTKYFGLALDRSVNVAGSPFLDLLKSKLRSDDTKVLLERVASSFDPTVFFLDLAEEMMTSALAEDISMVLYQKVLQWAGYSKDLKVARFEQMLESDGKFDTFKTRAKEELNGIDWIEVQNQPLVAVRVASQLAVEFYPDFFKSVSDFVRLMDHMSMGTNRRVEEMIDLIHRKSDRANMVFIFDDVDRYISISVNRALDFQSLNQCLASIGRGSICVMATAQPYHNAWDTSPSTCIVLEKFIIRIHLSNREAGLSPLH